MKALLLAAGEGTRLRPITNTIPKCLVPIQGRPLLDYWLDLLVKGGVSSILINLHYLSEKVYEHIASSSYKSYIKTVYEEELLGTGGTLVANREFFDEDTFMVAYADNLSKFDCHQFRGQHEKRPRYCEITMMTFETPTPESCGIVELDEEGVVQGFYEKIANSPSNLANAAVYLCEPTIWNKLEGKHHQVMDISRDIVPLFLGKIYTYHNSTYHRDIGTLESLSATEQEWQ